MKSFFAKLIAVEDIAHETKFFRFALDENSRDFKFEAGQFLSAKIAPRVFRAYSFCSSREILPHFELVIKLIPGGAGSTFFKKLQIGERIEFFAPFGRFVLPNNFENSNFVFVATGVGFAPFRSFLKKIFAQKNPPRVDLFFGFRNENFAIFLDEISALQKKFPQKFFPRICISQPQNLNSNCGRVTKFLENEPPRFFENKKVFLCGSRAMVESVRTILQNKKVADAQIFDEIY